MSEPARLKQLVPELSTRILTRQSELRLDKLERIAKLVDASPLIRVFLDGTPRFGHQKSSLRMVERIVTAYRYRGVIEIAYATCPDGDARTKIKRLLQGSALAKAKLQYLDLGDIRKEKDFERIQKLCSEKPVDFCCTGGADPPWDLAKMLNATYLLRLQPFLWKAHNRIERMGSDPVDLDVAPYIDCHFHERAFYIPPPAIDWKALASGADAADQQKIALAKCVCTMPNLRLVPTYGLAEGGALQTRGAEDVLKPASTSLLLFKLAVSTYMANRNASQHFPAIIISLDEIRSYSEWDLGALTRPEDTGMTCDELGLARRISELEGMLPHMTLAYMQMTIRKQIDACKAELAVAQARKQKLQELGASTHLHFWRVTDVPSPEALSKALGALGPDDVVIFQLGGVLPTLFDYLFSRATFSVLEGQNTASLALTLGIPYLHLPGLYAEGRNTYPSTCLQLPNASDSAAVVFAYAKQVAADLRTAEFMSSAQLLSFFVADVYKRDRELNAYFAAVSSFYGEAYNDKLLLALTVLEDFLARPLRALNTADVEIAAAMLAAAPPAQTLDDLLTALTNHLDGQQVLHLIPEALGNSSIAAFYQSITGQQTWQFTGANVVPQRDAQGVLIAVTASGHASAFGLQLGASLCFRTTDGQISSHGEYTITDPLGLDGAPWFSLADAGFAFDVAEGGALASGSLIGTLPGAGLKLALAFPVQDRWLLGGRFEHPQSVAGFFALAGGVDLMGSLPAPLSAIGGFGLSGVQILYDPAAAALESLQFQITSTNAWTLLPKVVIKPQRIDVTIYKPGSVSERSVQTSFFGTLSIGQGTIGVSAAVPDFTLQATLTDGSIQIADLLGAFGIDLPLDALGSIPAIVQLRIDYDWRAGNYRLQCGLGIPWTLTVPQIGPITIQSLTLEAYGQGGVGGGALSGLFAVGQPDASGQQATILLAASYPSLSGGWVFSGKLATGKVSLTNLAQTYLPRGWAPDHEYALTGLGASVDMGSGSYTLTGATDGQWALPILPDSSVAANLQLGYDGTAKAFSGQLQADITILGIALQAGFAFNPGNKTYTLAWEGVSGELSVPSDPTQPKQAKFSLSGVTLGGLIEKFVSWATGSRFGLASPWDLLHDVSLDCTVTFDFTDRPTKHYTVTFNYPLNIDLHIASVSGITITFDPTAQNKVNVKLAGNFPWQTAASDPLTWDASRPETTPAPPGGGNKYFDLRLLGLGQQVQINQAPPYNSVTDVINALAVLDDPQSGQLPTQAGQIAYNQASSWLIASSFGVLKLDQATPQGDNYFLDMAIVFNDPSLYGLHLKLAGKAAKIFAGLEFDILYRKISDTVGVYQAELQLPYAMRQFDMGAVTITLPSFALAIYTNGDFQIDVGFPWNQDFSRSFTMQAQIGPIPVLGSGGFYFGKLSSATTNKVPATTSGNFNPVIVFGIGMQLGLGKYIDKGIFKAGLSVTFVGIVEGVIARWHPNQTGQSGDSGSDQLQGEYYFWLQGTVGISARLFGSIDFVIIKASVDVTLMILAQITYESYREIPISVIASVDVSVTVSIDLGLFSIHLHFHFATSVSETFVLGSNQQAPWDPPQLVSPAPNLRARRLALAARPAFGAGNAATFTWSNLQPDAPPADLQAFCAPALTVVGDGATDKSQQVAAYVLLLFIESMDPNAGATGQPDTSFELLAKQVLRWVVAAAQTAPLSTSAVNQLPVSDDDLAAMLQQLADPSLLVPIQPVAVDTFMQGNFRLNIAAQSGQGSASATFFPMVPKLELSVPALQIDTHFDSFNSVSHDYLTFLRQYFAALEVQVEAEGNQPGRLKAAVNDPGLSMASYVYADYFQLLARQMLQAARDALRNFKFPFGARRLVSDIVQGINNLIKPSTNLYTAGQLFEANGSHPLNAGITLNVGYITGGGDTLAGLAGTRYAGQFTAAQLATGNAAVTGILVPGMALQYPNLAPYTVQPADSLNSIAKALQVSLADLIANSNLTTSPLAQGVALVLPLTCTTAAGDTLNAIAQRYAVPVEALGADVTGNAGAKDLFAAGDRPEQQYLNVPHLPHCPLGELINEAQRSLALQHLSGMTSRYFLHGLRLPPLSSSSANPPPRDAGSGLFALTGQQFNITQPGEQQPVKPFDIFLNTPPDLPWVLFE